MKVSVCYSGFLRNLHNSFDNIRSNLLDGHEVDYYIHTWENTEYNDQIKYAEKALNIKEIVVESPKNFEINPYLFINHNTNPKDYEKEVSFFSEESKIFFSPPSKENQYNFHKDLEVVKFKYYSSFPYSVLSQFYSICQSNFLRKLNQIDYDIVIRIRSDLFLNQKINLQDLKNNSINVINCNFHRGTNLTVNDHLAISNSKLMDIYSDLFVYIPAYYFIYKIDFISELILGHHLSVHNVDVKRHNISSSINRGKLNHSGLVS
jgi:hypothetical protein